VRWQNRDQLTNERKECWRLEAEHESNVAELKTKLQVSNWSMMAFFIFTSSYRTLNQSYILICLAMFALDCNQSKRFAFKRTSLESMGWSANCSQQSQRSIRQFKLQPVWGVFIWQKFSSDRFLTGNRLFHVVVDTDATAARILEAMRRTRSGRVTFMPLNRLNK